MKTKKSAFTLVELIVATVMISTVILVSINMILTINQGQNVSLESFEMNSAMRKAANESNNILRFSSALFTVPEGRFFEGNLTEGWNYYGLSENKKEVIKYTYEERENSSGVIELKHWKDIIIPEKDNIEYEITFEKSPTSEKIVNFSILAINTNSNTTSLAIESDVEVLNALQIVDRGTAYAPNVAIAYRADERPQDEIVGVITMVLDTSGSMAWNLDKSQTSNVPAAEQRIGKVKNALVGYTKANSEVVEGMINEFAKEDNIEIAVVPFSTTANTPVPTSNSSNGTHSFYKVADSSDRSSLISYVNSLSAVGGTNTGDAMRRAYYRNQYFKTNVTSMSDYGAKFSTRDYMIILVDGVTTFATSIGGSGDSKYKLNDGYVSNLSTPSNWDQAGIVGYGNAESTTTDRYVELIGAQIKGSNTKVYVIGFSNLETELASVSKIATAAGAKTANVYKFTDDLDLDQVFSEIKADIMKDLWHVRGPNL